MSSARTVGRPPDPAIEPRVFSAALTVYSKVGWTGFTLDAVSRHAKVGKAAIYGRWGDKVTLLTAALLSRKPEPEDIDTGSLRGDLLGVARIELRTWQEEFGQVLRRVEIDGANFPEVLGPVRDAFRRNVIDIGRHIVQRAVTRGELHAGASSGLILDALSGSIHHRLAFIPDDRRPDFDLVAADYLESLVDFVLAAAVSPHARTNRLKA